MRDTSERCPLSTRSAWPLRCRLAGGCAHHCGCGSEAIESGSEHARPLQKNSATFAQRASHHPDSNGLRGQHMSCAGRESLLCVHTEAAKISRGADMLECMVQVTATGGIEPFRLILRAVRKGRGRRSARGRLYPISLFSFGRDEFPVKSCGSTPGCAGTYAS